MNQYFRSDVRPPVMEGIADSHLEIRRILLLTRLRTAPKGMTMEQIVKDCGKVSGWNIPGTSLWDVVKLVLQSLIDDRLAAARARFVLTAKGREYLEDPLKWQIDKRTTEDAEKKLFWSNIYEIFDRAYRKMRSKT